MPAAVSSAMRFVGRGPSAARVQDRVDGLADCRRIEAVEDRSGGSTGLARQRPYDVTRARATAADSGKAYDGMGASAAGAPSERMNTPSTGLPGVPSRTRRHRRGDRRRIGDERRNEDRDHAVHRLVAEDRRSARR